MPRTYEQLSAEERGVIMALSSQGSSARVIARTLQRAPSTITRELRRNGFQREHEQCVIGRPRVAGGYNAQRAGARARRMRRLARPLRKLHFAGDLWNDVLGMLLNKLSPEQIAAALKAEFPGQPASQASHGTIYTAIYAAPKGELRRGLVGRCFAKVAVRAGHARGESIGVARCKTCSASTCDRPRPTTGCCPGIGRAIGSRAYATSRPCALG